MTPEEPTNPQPTGPDTPAPRKVIRIEDLRAAAADDPRTDAEIMVDLSHVASRACNRMDEHAAALVKNLIPKMDEVVARFRMTAFEHAFSPEFFERIRQQAAASLTLPNIDIDISGLLPKFDPEWLERIGHILRPRNLREGDFDFELMDKVMKEDGIPFCLVPDSETVHLILDAPDRPTRRRVLRDRSAEIFTACDDIIALCVDLAVAPQGSLIRNAIAAHNDGHTQAAQALATVVLDHLAALAVNRIYEAGITPSPEKAKEIKSAAVGNTFIEDNLKHQSAFFLHPLPFVHTKTDNIADPEAFNRHATIHTPTTQLTPANSVQAIMLATSLLGYHQNLW